MPLDVASLRVAFAVVAFTVGILFFFADFLSTRSPYSAWWCVSLALFLTGSGTLLLFGTPFGWWANPLGNSLLVGGGSAIWASARALRALRAHPWVLAAGPACAALAAALDSPATNIWAGDAVFLFLMSLMIGLAARELWPRGQEVSRIRLSMAIAATTVSAFYLCRFLVFILDGPTSDRYTSYFGPAATTLVGMAFLAVASFSMFALSNENRARVLKTAASHDGLTGLLNRTGFFQEAAEAVQEMRNSGGQGSLILADLDHFKEVNDNYGHAAGDTAIKAFAGACRAAVRSGDVVGRVGGEEFILLLPGVGTQRAQQIAADVSRRFETASASAYFPMPTASYGIVAIDKETPHLDDVIASADAALYQAKSLGRNRSVVGKPGT